MVGGGIFAVLGVVVSLAGPLYWLALSIAGLLAFLTARSYVRLAVRFEEGGGAFEYLRDLDRPRLAGGLGWLLLLGYTLTIALYAATFGSYLAHALGAGGAVVRFAAVGLVAVVVGINLRGTGSSASVEITAVLVELAILAGLVVGGLADWRLSAATTTLATPSIGGLAMASAAVFVAYEGFQLTTYDWDEIDRPDRTLPRTVPIAVVVVVATYLLVATAVVMVLTGDGVVQAGEVALAVAGQEQFGTAGLVAITLAALFATGSAVNSTLFSTARLARRIAHDGELPAVIEDAGDTGVPRRALLVLGGVAAFVAVVGWALHDRGGGQPGVPGDLRPGQPRGGDPARRRRTAALGRGGRVRRGDGGAGRAPGGALAGLAGRRRDRRGARLRACASPCWRACAPTRPTADGADHPRVLPDPDDALPWRAVNLLDVVLLVMIALAAVTGYRLGLAARAISWAGGLLGLALSAVIVPAVLQAWPGGDAVTRLLIGLMVVLVTTSVLSGIGEVLGLRLRHRVHATPFGPIDRVAGGIAGGLSVLLLVWFLLPALSSDARRDRA